MWHCALWILVVTGGGLLAFLPLSIWFYAKKDQTRPAAAAVILGAAVYRKVPSPVFRERILHGVQLYEQGKVKRLIFTGGRAQGDKYSEAEAGRRLAMDHGVPSRHILTETRSTTTHENLLFSKPLIEQAGGGPVLVVSDPLHMRRSMMIARNLEIDAYSSPTPTSLYRSLDSRLHFLFRECYFTLGFALRLSVGEH